VRARLARAHGIEAEAIEICVIRTTGDAVQNRPLVEIGGKGLFTKEIEQALVDGGVDLAVHSAKDVPAVLPEGLILAACLPREDPRDALISHVAAELAALPHGAVVGTASPRRQAMVKRLRPDLTVIGLRGNVETRLRKLEEGEADATLLAVAGLKRLGLIEKMTSVLETDDFLPAVGQGIITIEARKSDQRTRGLLAAIDDSDASGALGTERAFLAVLEGSCRTPIAGHARLTDTAVDFRGLIVKPDGSQSFETVRRGSRSDSAALGRDAGHELKGRAGPDFFASG
jgi:hydroxymethylbilane synthase